MAGSDAPAKKKGGGLIGFLIPLVVLTAMAAGGGWMMGTQIIAAIKAAAAPKPAVPAVVAESTVALKELTPIVTNLAAPNTRAWIRLQAAVVYEKADAPQIDILAAKVGDDVLSVMRTLTLEDLQGASGLELLREDLNERASIRSDGHIKELIIEMLVIQ